MSDLSPELQAELVEFVRGCPCCCDPVDYCRRCVMLAKLPPPPDPDIEELADARTNILITLMTFEPDVRARDLNANEINALAKAALAAKRGRELERSGK